MNISPVDSQNNLFQVENVFPEEVIQDVHRLDLMNLSYKNQDQQEQLPRRVLIDDEDIVLNTIQSQRWDLMEAVSSVSGYTYTQASYLFWLDLPGFTFFRHFDNSSVDAAMLVYLTTCPDAGTAFYWPDHRQIVREGPDQPKSHHYATDLSVRLTRVILCLMTNRSCTACPASFQKKPKD